MEHNTNNCMDWTQEDVHALAEAKEVLENPDLVAVIANMVGYPIEMGLMRLPRNIDKTIKKASSTALLKGMEFAIASLDRKGTNHNPGNFLHKAMAGTTGAIGGWFGLVSLPIELPISTILLLRSIANIARSEGHDLSLLDTRLQCVQVFAFGAAKRKDQDSSDLKQTNEGYWFTRSALAGEVSRAIAYLGEKGLAGDAGGPILARLSAKLATTRFVTIIEEKFGVKIASMIASKAVPVIGAITGGALNVVFMNLYQKLAWAHFTILRLEKKYGTECVQLKYQG